MAGARIETPYDNPYDDDNAVLDDDFLNDGTAITL